MKSRLRPLPAPSEPPLLHISGCILDGKTERPEKVVRQEKVKTLKLQVRYISKRRILFLGV